MSVTVKFTGLKKVNDKLKDLAKKYPLSFEKTVKKAAFAIDKQAKEPAPVGAPVDTGRLRSSLKVEILDGGKTAEVSANTNYAAAVELGTSKQKPQPYLGPAFRAIKVKFPRMLGEQLKKDGIF